MKQILFVDDDADFLEGLKRILRSQRQEWNMQFVDGVDAAMAVTGEVDLDAIVSAADMPVKSGLDLLKELQSSPATSTIPTVILTGSADSNLKRRALDLGATDLLSKPVEPEDLLARIRSVIRLKDYQDQILDQNVLLEHKVRERTRDLEHSRLDIVWRLAKAGEFRDEETGQHVMRVAWCSQILAKQLGLDKTLVAQIFATSPLHDIGKIGIPDGILLKKGELDPQEWAFMERHCAIGAAILMDKPKGLPLEFEHGDEAIAANDENSLLTLAAEIALNHHERWDGAGYPNRLAGEDIPISGRIVAVADVYDALRSARSYKDPCEVEEVVNMIEVEAGKQFSPAIVKAFGESVAEFEAIRARYEE